MSSFADQFLKVGLVTPEKHATQLAKEQAKDRRASSELATSFENKRIEELLEVLNRVTSLKRFQGAAFALLQLRPLLIDDIVQLAARLSEQEGLSAFKEKLEHLAEWLPSLTEDEQVRLVEQTLN